MAIERCEECPLNIIDNARNRTHAGRLLEHILNLDFDVEAFSVPYDTIKADEATGLKVLREERNKFNLDKAKDDREKAEEQRRIEQLGKARMPPH